MTVFFLFLLVVLCQHVWAENYTKPDYERRPLTSEQNIDLLKKCGQQLWFPEKKVMNGESVERSAAPWVVAIVMAIKWKPNMTPEELYNVSVSQCTGQLISRRHVLTAAHCIEKSLHRMLIVVTRKCSTNTDEKECSEAPTVIRQTFKAYQSVRYGEKPEGTLRSYGDVGIYEMSEDVEYSDSLYPICLGDYKLDIGEPVDYYGFGGDGTVSAKYMLAHMNMTVAECPPSTYADEYKVDMMCAYSKYQEQCGLQGFEPLVQSEKLSIDVSSTDVFVTERDFLQLFYLSSQPEFILQLGDSGGGLVHTRRATKSVFSVTSFGMPCAVMNSINVFGEDIFHDYMTDIRPHLYWICGATGVCANEKVVKDVADWVGLPNRHRDRYATFSALEEWEIYV